MFPTTARMYLSATSMEEYFKDKFTFWEDVYGFDFSTLTYLAQQKALSQPEITILNKEQVLFHLM